DNFTSFTFSEETKNLLKIFPPLHTFFGEYKSAVSANTFLYQKINSVVSSYPLFIFNDINNSKIGVITGIGLWQWKLHNYQVSGNFDAFNEIIGKTVQFLSVKNDKSFFRVNAKQLFNENENVVFDASLYNDSYELINEPDIELVLTNPADNTYDYRFSKKDLAYELDLGQLPSGNYKWQASTKLGTKGYTKNGQFTVREMLMETANLVADHDILQMISNATKGNFYLPQEMHQIEQVIKENDHIKPIVSYQKNYKMMLNSPIYFIFIILLFGIEWFLRKWGGAY
ncbi:MAG: hypothetical protein LBU51_03810, partial [Bacteroidales bacterium]|nr:hypothetical protein [Bacteroidales bacterium]